MIRISWNCQYAFMRWTRLIFNNTLLKGENRRTKICGNKIIDIGLGSLRSNKCNWVILDLYIRIDFSQKIKFSVMSISISNAVLNSAQILWIIPYLISVLNCIFNSAIPYLQAWNYTVQKRKSGFLHSAKFLRILNFDLLFNENYSLAYFSPLPFLYLPIHYPPTKLFGCPYSDKKNAKLCKNYIVECD